MKANKIQHYLCDVIHRQQFFWRNSNDITSPTHLIDIDEECYVELCDLISDEDIKEFQEKLKDLYLSPDGMVIYNRRYPATPSAVGTVVMMLKAFDEGIVK